MYIDDIHVLKHRNLKRLFAWGNRTNNPILGPYQTELNIQRDNRYPLSEKHLLRLMMTFL